MLTFIKKQQKRNPTMNGKKAKLLRKIARQATVGLENVNYVIHENTGQVQNGKCTRKLYKLLKKSYKNGSDLNGMVSSAR